MPINIKKLEIEKNIKILLMLMYEKSWSALIIQYDIRSNIKNKSKVISNSIYNGRKDTFIFYHFSLVSKIYLELSWFWTIEKPNSRWIHLLLVPEMNIIFCIIFINTDFLKTVLSNLIDLILVSYFLVW